VHKAATIIPFFASPRLERSDGRRCAKIVNFYSGSRFYRNKRHVVQKKMGGGGGVEMVTKEEVVTKEEMVVVAKGKLRRSRWPRRNARR
jgi:hypothetical protein